MLFESYEAMAAYGTWFGGILTAIAVISSVMISTRTVRKKTRITFKEYPEVISINVINEGKDPIIIYNLGVYVSGRLFDIIETDDLIINPGQSQRFDVLRDQWKKIKADLLHDINWDLNNSLYMQAIRWIKKKDIIVKSDKIERKLRYPCYSIKIGAQLSDGLYLTKKWLTTFMFEPQDERKIRRANHSYNTCRIYLFDTYGVFLSILCLMILTIHFVYYTGSDVAIVIFAACCVAYYICLKVESMNRVHPAGYYCCLGLVLIGIINVMILTIIRMNCPSLIIFELIYCVMFGLPLLTKILEVTGRAGNLY